MTRAISPCSVDECAKPSKARGICGMHIERMRTHGSFADPRPTTDQRFWAAVQKTETCWLWQGAPTSEGYGSIRIGGRAGGPVYAHRYAYQTLVGPIEPGLHLDHLCRVRLCVNPAHLEPVTPQVNTLRGAAPNVAIYHSGACARGHERNPENTYTNPKTGARGCRPCRRANDKARRLRSQLGEAA